MLKTTLVLLFAATLYAQVPGGLPCTPMTTKCTVNAQTATYTIQLGCFDSPDCVTGVECEEADYTYDLCTCTVIVVGFTDYCSFGLSTHPGNLKPARPAAIFIDRLRKGGRKEAPNGFGLALASHQSS
jgi:hypothetical protein